MQKISNSLKMVGERFILIDEVLTYEKREQLEEIQTIDGQGFGFLEDIKLSRKLDYLLEDELRCDTKDTLIVFLGNGAQYPRRQLKSLDELMSCDVPAKRVWIPRVDPVCFAGEILPEKYFPLGIKKIVVIDDVISSGKTMLALHRANAWRIPGAQWVAATWVLQPLKKLSGFTRILSACEVGKVSGLKSAVNSLSTLVANSEMATNYAERHIKKGYRERFLDILQK